MAQSAMDPHVARTAKHFDVVEIEKKVRALPGADTVVQTQSLARPATSATPYARDVILAKALIGLASARLSWKPVLTPCLFVASPRAKPTRNAKQLLRANAKHLAAVLALQKGARHSLPGTVALEGTEPRHTLGDFVGRHAERASAVLTLKDDLARLVDDGVGPVRDEFISRIAPDSPGMETFAGA